jgi:hypothetical protein
MFEDRGEALIASFGDLATHAENALIDSAAGDNLAMAEGIRLRLAGLRSELAGPDPTPLIRVLAERAALCWCAVNEFERRYLSLDEITSRQAEWLDRRINSAHRRFLSAMKVLATVRKLAIPALQLNIAKKQINMLGVVTQVDE